MKASARSACRFCALVYFAAASGLAQDVTVTPPQWFMDEPAPDVLPAPKNRLRPDFPKPMRSTTEPGYVMIVRYVSAKGESLRLQAVGADRAYQSAVEEEFSNWKMAAGTRGGKSVNSSVWVGVLFNPKSAAPETPDASPRLLTPAMIVVPENTRPLKARFVFRLDASGTVTEVTPEGQVNPVVVESLQKSLPQWKFAPARKAGAAVPSEQVMSVVCVEERKPDFAKVEMPQPTKQVRPIYPFGLRASRMGGKVVLSFFVDVDGSVKEPRVVESDNPGFNDAARDALLQWRFKPGTRDGVPTKLQMMVPIIFDIEGGADKAYSVTGKNDQSKLPENLRYDTPPKVRGTVVPVYPYALQRDKVRGKAKLLLGINAEGHVVETRVLETTHPEFAAATIAAVESFRFDPAIRDAKAVSSVLRFEQEFNDEQPAGNAVSDLLSTEKNHPERIINAAKLDAKLKPLSTQPPIFPRSVASELKEGQAIVEILIDRDGKVRLPRVISASHETLGYAAVQAVSVWLFEPPKSEGKAVITRIRVPFQFKPPGSNGDAKSNEAAAPEAEKKG